MIELSVCNITINSIGQFLSRDSLVTSNMNSEPGAGVVTRLDGEVPHPFRQRAVHVMAETG